MKRTIALLTLLGLVGSASAATIAEWRFEEGTAGVQHTGTYDNFYLDGSGNGNHLSAESSIKNPVATNEVLSTGGSLSADFEKVNAQQVGTWATGPTSDKMIDSYSFTGGWTVAASFKMESWNWAVVVGKDGQPDPGRGEQCLSIKINDGNHHLFCGFYDNNTNYHEMFSLEPLELDQWYSAVMTYDNNKTTLYLKKEGVDANFVGQTSLPVPAGAALDLEDNFWVVGRGMWQSGTGGDIFDGLIDEVKIDDVAMAPPGAIWPFIIEPPADPVVSGFRDWSTDFNLASSGYNSPPGLIFTNSQWQISSSTDFSSPAWDSGEIGTVTSVTVPAGTLADGTYYGRARYKGDDTWSDWSNTSALTFFGIETIAYWRLDSSEFSPQPADGVEHAGDQDNWYSDVSGNGNHMSSWHDGARPASTTNIPFATIQGIGPNTLALDFDADDIGTFGDVTGAKMVESYAFTNGWTIECSFMANDLGAWRVMLGKDGKRVLGPEEPFSFKLAPDAENFGIRCLVLSDDDDFHFIDTSEIVAGKWYTVVATYDNAEFRVYLKSEDDADFTLEGTLARTLPITFGGLNTATWTIGRGMWEGNPVDNFFGQIDEVRITHGVRFPSEFIQKLDSVPPIGDITLENLGTGNLALTWNTGLFHSYVLLEKNSLQDPTWSTNQAGIPGTESNVTVTVSTAPEDETFYAVTSED